MPRAANATKNGAYIINLDEYKSTESQWTAIYINGNKVKYFDSFGVEHIPKDIEKFIGNKNITIVFRIQACDSTMCEYFCIGCIDFMLEGKSLINFTNLLSSKNLKINDKVILNYFLN